ncbi:hypothetical protein V6N12_026139 [Hibiscus sabdariffa]|uniref:Uncharacterized protein n=1 Tax=Hibiscus sabdariffa TaxID=183260 RepID=A0ABR2DQW9_9ROSI
MLLAACPREQKKRASLRECGDLFEPEIIHNRVVQNPDLAITVHCEKLVTISQNSPDFTGTRLGTTPLCAIRLSPYSNTFAIGAGENQTFGN